MKVFETKIHAREIFIFLLIETRSFEDKFISKKKKEKSAMFKESKYQIYDTDRCKWRRPAALIGLSEAVIDDEDF